MKYYTEPDDALDVVSRSLGEHLEECLFTRVRFFGPRGEHDRDRDVEGALPEEYEAYASDTCGAPGCPTRHDHWATCPVRRRAVFRLERDGDGFPLYRFAHWA